MEAYGFEVEEELSTMATQYWAEGVWTGRWHHDQKEAWMRQVQEVQMWRPRCHGRFIAGKSRKVVRLWLGSGTVGL